jgi:hypothetical protein
MVWHHRDLKRETTWRRHIRRQRASGLTVRDYCFEHHLTESAFYFWRRTIAERDHQQAAEKVPAFMPVTVIDQPARPNISPIDIRLSNGRRVRVRSDCDRELLAAVLTLLETPSC